MKVTHTSTSITCDCCYTSIPSRLYYLNDGSYQSDTINFKGLDICHICAARLFEEHMPKLDIDPSTLKECYVPSHKRHPKLNFDFPQGYKDRTTGVNETPIIS